MFGVSYECDPSDHPVSVVVGVGVVGVVVIFSLNFFSFSTSSNYASKFVWMFLGRTPTQFVKIGVLPLFFMELWVNL